MTYEELKQDLLDAYEAMQIDIDACIKYTNFLEGDSKKIEECKKAIADHEKKHKIV